MGHIVYDQGEQHIVETYFTATSFTGPFYIGLGVGAFPQAESSSLADVTEVNGLGYARQPVQRDASPFGWSVGDPLCPMGTAQAAEITWKNISTDLCWDPADYAFLTTSPLALDEPNILIAAVDLANTVILEPQKKLKMIFRFQQV